MAFRGVREGTHRAGVNPDAAAYDEETKAGLKRFTETEPQSSGDYLLLSAVQVEDPPDSLEGDRWGAFIDSLVALHEQSLLDGLAEQVDNLVRDKWRGGITLDDVRNRIPEAAMHLEDVDALVALINLDMRTDGGIVPRPQPA